jgi:nitroreductase
MQFRHACKVFDEKNKISAEDFKYILEAARLSPSSFGYEPWHFLVVQNMDLREKLKQFTWGAQGTLPTASHFVIALARKAKTMRYDSDYIEHMMSDIHHIEDAARNKRRSFYQTFQEQDFHLIDNDKAMFDWACKQTYIALANMMNAAAYIKIDSCPIEGFQEDKINQLLADEFNIDTSVFQVSYMVAFGYRKDPQRVKTRQPIDDIVTWYQ